MIRFDVIKNIIRCNAGPASNANSVKQIEHSNIIAGTEETRQLIGEITNDLLSKTAGFNAVNYNIRLEKKGHFSELVTDEYCGNLRNVSIIRIDDIEFGRDIGVAIGNKTGNILPHQMPNNMDSKKLIDVLVGFLKLLQPENMEKSKDTKLTNNILSGSKTEILEVFKKFENYEVFQRFEGSESKHSFECFEPYIKL